MPKPGIISIDYLADQEYKIYKWVSSLLNGTRSEEDLIFKNEAELDYKEIHLCYLYILNTSKDENIKVEALKRLIFLNWYFMLEPDFLTGIAELDDSAIVNSFEILNGYIKEEKLDSELTWMLEYFSSCEYIIYQYSEGKLDELTSFVNSVDTSKTSMPRKVLPKGTMDNRGQMGIYWKQFVERID